MNFARELEVARRLALEAGDIALRYHGTELTVERKDEGEPVTRADKEANAVIVAGLAREFPDDALLAEETPDDGSRLQKNRVWMVDPIDGTRDFIRGRDGFSVMIGLLESDRPALGVVWQPIGRRLYFASRGEGAWLAENDAAPERIHTSTISTPEEIRLVASKSHRTPVIDEVRAQLGIKDELNVGSVGLKLGLIARGLRDLYVNPSSKSSAWDTCGPEAILTEAGGKLSDLWGRLIDYRATDVKNRDGLVASNGPLHQLVLEKIRPLFPHGAE
jgi:3'(2'), 5'-bisphosphate nucleotidase